jgi:hypothetical protein
MITGYSPYPAWKGMNHLWGKPPVLKYYGEVGTTVLYRKTLSRSVQIAEKTLIHTDI